MSEYCTLQYNYPYKSHMPVNDVDCNKNFNSAVCMVHSSTCFLFIFCLMYSPFIAVHKNTGITRITGITGMTPEYRKIQYTTYTKSFLPMQ